MLVFFNGKDELSDFASKFGCTAYHNDLFEPGTQLRTTFVAGTWEKPR